MLEGSSALKVIKNPAKKRGRIPFQKIQNTLTGKTRNLVEKQLPIMKVSHNNFKTHAKEDSISTFSPYSIDSSSLSTGGAIPQEFSKLNVFTRRGLNKVLSGAEKVITIAKENVVNPFPVEHYNTPSIALGRTVERDFKTAQKMGGLLSSRLLGGWTAATNYPRNWASNIFKYLAPEWVQRKVHSRVVKNHDIWTSPFKKIFGGGKKLYQKIRMMIKKGSLSPNNLRKWISTKKKKQKERTLFLSKTMNKAVKIITKNVTLPRLKISND